MATTKQKLSKFRRTDDSKPLKESLNDNLPNLTGLSEKVPKDTNENTVSISKRDLIVEKENSDDFNLYNMLEKRRKKDDISLNNEELDKFPESDDELSKLFDEP